jgi:hypothetical protein
MTNLDMLLLRGASSMDAEEGLAELRYTILTKGIPANSEGMVSFPTTNTTTNNNSPIAHLSPLDDILCS